MDYFLCWGVDRVIGVVVVVVGVRNFLALWVLILYFLIYIYLALRVRACGCVIHEFGQFWLQFCGQKNCSAIYSAIFFSFVGVL